MKRVAFLALFLLAPGVLFAQEDALRSQIRADLMQDPRSQEMSQAEEDALVEELATQAEADGTSAAYLESKNTFDPSSLFSPPQEPSAVARTIFSPLSLAVVLLILALSVVTYYIIRRGKASVASDIA